MQGKLVLASSKAYGVAIGAPSPTGPTRLAGPKKGLVVRKNISPHDGASEACYVSGCRTARLTFPA